MELALREYDIPLMKTTIGNRNIYENSSSGLSVLEIGARSASDREGQREMRELVREIERLLSISRQSGKTSAKNDKKKTATI
ncbi:MAG: hypothetical protein H0W77_08700 [Acidobacteria bacterium]|nr:hypothetical protein [Acidobacteriota bacterium]